MTDNNWLTDNVLCAAIKHTVIVEAMTCSSPMIGAASGGPLDFVSEGVEELVPEVDTSDKIAVSLNDAVQCAVKEDWKAKRGAACMALVDAKYSARGQCTDLLANAKKMLGQE
jgi:glycosyltransferase involved in cell wall biosynthesis